MIKSSDVRSVVIDWPAKTLEITDKDDDSKHIVGLDQTIHVTMVGFPDREEKQMSAGELGDYMSKGYIIETIIYEEE